jgi:hypothetical protein
MDAHSCDALSAHFFYKVLGSTGAFYNIKKHARLALFRRNIQEANKEE